ncbi:MAG: putative 60S ribosomal protein L33 [Streblomastix strix]|uniref:Putative 60S ribosomal protein L33 n=1 Tax=Streblomastix strix TaxID=222440 RepID=A0A5J4X0E2_9EUKA|nr:MAG: putative 60S ribosomal protein L33 [Streblomastix strix]
MAHRLHLLGRILGYQRGLHTQHPNFSLVEIEGCTSKEGARYYLGKTVYYIYKVKKSKKNIKGLRSVRGKVVKVHGNSGVVRVSFKHNLPGTSFGRACRIMLYPQH